MLNLLNNNPHRPDRFIDLTGTGGHTIYHLQPAKVKGIGKRALISAAYDGFVLCNNQKGKLLWEN